MYKQIESTLKQKKEKEKKKKEKEEIKKPTKQNKIKL